MTQTTVEAANLPATTTTEAPAALTAVLPASWPAELLSPAAMISPDRGAVCAVYHTTLVDHSEAEAHLAAALEHMRRAADAVGREPVAYRELRDTVNAMKQQFARMGRSCLR